MRLVLLGVGRMKQGPERDLLVRYADRAAALARSAALTGFALREIEEGRGRTAAERARGEARALSAELGAGTIMLALDERAAPLSSEGFAALVGRHRDAGRPALAVVVGGPDGFDADFRAGAHHVASYGAATFPHQLVRVLAAEQCYRAMTILAGHPYHRA